MATARQWRGIAIGAVLAGVIALGAAAWTVAAGWRPDARSYPIQGVDVSDAHGPIDWATVRAGGADFAYLRATRGAGERDARFAANWAGAHAAGLRRGASHAFAACQPAAGQARNFMVTVPRTRDALPMAVTIDAGAECAPSLDRAALVGELRRFIARVERHTGERVLVQVTPDVERRYRLSSALDRSLWATGSYVAPTYLARPWRMWQANAGRRIDGAGHAVGWDVVAP